MTPNNPRITAE